MKKFILFLAVISILTACSSIGSGGAYRQVSSAEAQKLMESELDYFILVNLT